MNAVGESPSLLPLLFLQAMPTQCQGHLPQTPDKVKSLSALTSNACHYYWEKPTFLILTHQVPLELALATSLVLSPTPLYNPATLATLIPASGPLHPLLFLQMTVSANVIFSGRPSWTFPAEAKAPSPTRPLSEGV